MRGVRGGGKGVYWVIMIGGKGGGGWRVIQDYGRGRVGDWDEIERETKCALTREKNLILLREGRSTIKMSIRSPFIIGFKSAINIRQMYFMNPLNPTSRCEKIL